MSRNRSLLCLHIHTQTPIPQPQAARHGEMPAAHVEIWSPVWVGIWEDVAGKIDVTMVPSTAPLSRQAGSFLQRGRKGDLPGVMLWPLESSLPYSFLSCLPQVSAANKACGIWGPTVALCSLKTHLHYADHPFQKAAPYSSSQNLTHGEHC